MRSKAYQTIKAKAPAEPVDLAAAVAFIKKHSRKSFDETIELHIRLGVDPAKSDQLVRGSVDLPAGAPKHKRIVVFADTADVQAAAKKAGAAIAGGQELVEQITKEGKLDADLTVATPDMMPHIAKAARILGPQGLMPNPKTGTVTPDPTKTIKEMIGGKLSFKMDQLGNIHEAVAKVSWPEEKIVRNVDALLTAINDVRPPAAKGQLLKNVTLKSTMGPAIKLAVSS